jgi:predicted Zn-dependent protease
MIIGNRIRVIFVVGMLALCGGCTPGSGFQKLGSSILSSTGIVTSSQADALFSAGGKLAKAASPISDEEEYYLGRGVAAVVLSKYKPYRHAGVVSYVNKVGAAVVAHSSRPETFGGYHVQVLDTPEINAISAPGGFIFITRGFLAIMPDEDALAAVLAHEVGHIALGHGVAAISQANLTEALTILGKEAVASSTSGLTAQLTVAFGDSVKDIADTLLTKGYSRSQEYAADEYAAEVLRRTGYDSKGLAAMLHALEKRSGAGGSEDGWYSTHPAPERRLNELDESVVAGVTTSQGVAARVARFRAAMKPLM